MPRVFKILFVGGGFMAAEPGLRDLLSAQRIPWRADFAPSLEESAGAPEPDCLVVEEPASPAGGGSGLVSGLRKRCPGIPVVLVSAAADPRDLRDLLCAGAGPTGPHEKGPRPEGLLFRRDLFPGGDLSQLVRVVERALFECGRVPNESGVLITHGTDTMAWGLAYLRYALKGLQANVALTGSQVPLEGTFSASDALGNLKTAVYLLNRLRPAHLFAVFNNGRQVFSGRLTKFRKWDSDAFDGRVAASAGPEGVHTLRREWVFIPYEDQKLEDLHLVRTGGTIESQHGPGGEGALRPTGDFVWQYVADSLSGWFERAHRHDLCALDSSNMSFEDWERVARTVEALGLARADTRFDLTVRPVFANPLFATSDYRNQFAACGRGAVFAGYGGGNANVLEGSPRSVLPALRQSVEAGTFVAVTSQVPLEPYDAEYETGFRLLEAGGIPCGDLPLADAQVKLSYLLGHWSAIEDTASRSGLDPRGLLTAAFLSGVSMRKAVTLDRFREMMGSRGSPLEILPDDPFVGGEFGEGLERVARTLRA